MPDKFKAAINLPLQIPAWSVVCGILVMVFWGGYYGSQVLNDVRYLVELNKENKLAISNQGAQIDRINERQIGGLATLNSHGAQIVDLQSRVITLERRGK